MQSNVAVVQRFGPGANGNPLTKGGAQERRVTSVCLDIIFAAQKLEALFPDGTDKNNMMTAFDNLITYVHTAGTKLPN